MNEVCGRKPSDPHHLRQQPAALGREASDEFAVLLRRAHHRAVHCSLMPVQAPIMRPVAS